MFKDIYRSTRGYQEQEQSCSGRRLQEQRSSGSRLQEQSSSWSRLQEQSSTGRRNQDRLKTDVNVSVCGTQGVDVAAGVQLQGIEGSENEYGAAGKCDSEVPKQKSSVRLYTFEELQNKQYVRRERRARSTIERETMAELKAEEHRREQRAKKARKAKRKSRNKSVDSNNPPEGDSSQTHTENTATNQMPRKKFVLAKKTE